MPFDPNIPANNSPNSSAQMRAQLTSLKALIDAVPTISGAVVDAVNTVAAGQPAAVNLNVSGSVLHLSFDIPQGQEGPMGQQGPPFASAVVDSVTTLNPGESATVSANFDGANVHLIFGIPRGTDGGQGPQGNDGPQGPPFANAVVDSVTTLNPGQQATVQAIFDGSNVRFAFGIPRGNDGNNGADGAPGEVTTFQMNDAIAMAIGGTSSNTNAVSAMDTPFTNDPPTLSDLELMRTKFNELVLALRR